MNKEEFMTRLKELLADLPDDENKQDALNYYQDYLEEAGENTAAVLKEFGSPERIASMIRCDLNGELNEGGDFTDHGIEDTRFKEPGYDVAKRLDLPEVMEEETAKQGQEKESFHADNTSQAGNGRKRRGFVWWQILLIVLAVILFGPAIAGGVGILLAILVGIIGALVVILLGIGAGTIFLFFLSAVMLIQGIYYLYLADLYGLWWLGWGFLGMSGTILLVLVSILFYGKLVPMVFVNLVNRLNRLLHRKGRE